MTKEKIASLTKHLVDSKNKLTSPTPDKHKNHSVTYKQFLLREVAMATEALEKAKLAPGEK